MIKDLTEKDKNKIYENKYKYMEALETAEMLRPMDIPYKLVTFCSLAQDILGHGNFNNYCLWCPLFTYKVKHKVSCENLYRKGVLDKQKTIEIFNN